MIRTVRERYLLKKEIGQGGSGSVWVAEDRQLKRDVALKLLRDEGRARAELCARFELEAQMIAQLRCAHVVQVFDSGVDAGQPFIVMELLEGETLDARLARHTRLPLPVVVDFVVQVARGLSSTHAAGIIHRDLKPANVFLSREFGRERIKLLDFGVATLSTFEASAPRLAGTPLYMSPEQFAGAEPCVQTDLWSLSVMAYQLLTGICPFRGDSLLAVRTAVYTGIFTPPSQLVPGLSPEVDGVFATALALAADARPGSAAELAKLFTELLQHTTQKPLAILLVDDEPDVEFVVRRRLRRKLPVDSFELLYAENGAHALEVMQRRPDIDVVLSDINMPVMDGLTLLSRVPDVNPVARVVVISAYGDMTNIRTAMNRGAFDFLCKPIDFEDLERTIAKCAEHVALLRTALSSREENSIMRLLVGPGIVDRMLSASRSGADPEENFEATLAYIAVVDELREGGAAPLRRLADDVELCLPELRAQDGQLTRLQGECLLAVFRGRDHVQRALDAALAIRDRLAVDGRGRAARIGLDSGLITAGSVGSVATGRIEPVLLGSAVSRAMELHTRARAGEILTSIETLALFGDDYLTELVVPALQDAPATPAVRALARRSKRRSDPGLPTAQAGSLAYQSTHLGSKVGG